MIGTIKIISCSTLFSQIIFFRNVSTIKGELLPIIVKKQFSKQSKIKDTDEKRSVQDFVETEPSYSSSQDKRLYSCYAYTTDLPCYRVNTLPAYWHCNNLLRWI